jgi:hypothetical protein
MARFSLLVVAAAAVVSLVQFSRAPLAVADSNGLDNTFEAFDLKSGELLFRGETVSRQEGGHTKESVRDFDPSGTVIQTLETEFDTGSAKLFSLRREYPLTGESESAVIESDRVKMTHRESASAEEKHEEMKWTGMMVFPPTVVPRIQLAWEALKAGKKVEVEMVVPSRLDSYRFRLVKEAVPEPNGNKVVVIVLEPGSILVRRLVDPMRFVWSVEAPRRVLEYLGRTTIKDAKGDQIDARIVYHYSDP